ncbi:lysine N(6)-hydroxylase/L-ornithine N(5)-oxygenase family protein [Streptomyces sp. NPDC056121]|uniref:lysine N(6)-hydroxylase/L-ornithine N(5)-oxygenase family protein n=1 Tax=Streptomyces sp. NPDC056121 TaxID=3345718 RepID=UPI0035E3720B
MTAPTAAALEPVLDVLGVGFGPSNLGLAIAIDERNQAEGLGVKARFIERKPSFGWHRGMLIEGATMQVSFLKDLVTMRNPVSGFSFLSYLHEKGRMADFINHKDFYPSRLEFHDYLEWAAARVASDVTYGTEVVGVEFDPDQGETLAVSVREVDDPRTVTVYRTRNLVIASGLIPKLPEGVTRSERVWHSSELLDRLEEVRHGAPRRFAVVGAGQSGAEATAHLHDVFPEAEVFSVIPRYGYSPADDSSFANRVFDPATVNEFFGTSADVKQKFYAYHANTNYSVVDNDLISELYRRSYLEGVKGHRRLHLLNMSRVDEVATNSDNVNLRVQLMLDDTSRELDVDYVVFATGYHPMDCAGLLGGVLDSCKRESDGRLRVGRNYRVVTSEDLTPGIYVQGGVELSHGITSSLLSNIAVRSGEIVDSILQRPVTTA